MKHTKHLLLLGVLASLAGCASTENSIKAAHPIGTPASIVTAHVVNDKRTSIYVADIRETQADNGIHRLSVDFANRAHSPRQAYYRLEWFDVNGMDIASSLVFWKKIEINGQGVQTVAFTAPSAEAVDFKIKLTTDPY